MDLPIDARRSPFNPKYIDEETAMFNLWHIFGRDSKDGTYCIVDASGNDIITGLTLANAERLVRIRTTFTQDILDILNSRG